MVMRFLRMVTEIGTSESPQGRLYEANLLRATLLCILLRLARLQPHRLDLPHA